MRIALLGDIAFFGRFCLSNNKSARDYFQNVAEYLSEFDLVVGNLEAPFNDNFEAKGSKSAYISSNPINVELLKHLNIGLVNLANNHIFDFGDNAYLLTKRILEDNGIEHFGTEGKNYCVTQGNNKLCFEGACSYTTNPTLDAVWNGKNKGVNPLHFEEVSDILRANKECGVLTVLSVHSGTEHVNYPSREDIKMARKLAEIAPYVYYGHHPHVVQGLEECNEALIAYSLGNFCFDDVYTSKSAEPLIKQTDNNKFGLLLEIEVNENKVSKYKPVPIFAASNRMELGAEALTKDLKQYSEALNMNEPDYSLKRNKLIQNFIGSRKSARNLEWYLKRLNFNSVGMIYTAFVNGKKQKLKVSDVLSKEN